MAHTRSGRVGTRPTLRTDVFSSFTPYIIQLHRLKTFSPSFHIYSKKITQFSFLGDRYDREPRGTDQFDEFDDRTTHKGKIREWRERAGSYGEYRDKER